MLNKWLATDVCQEWLRKHIDQDPKSIALRKSPWPEVTSLECAQQIEGLRTMAVKVPSWFAVRGLIYPPKLNIEQSSSEATAHYKASLVNGHSLWDLSGGLGVDTWAFAQRIERVTHVERNAELSALVKHNMQVLALSERVDCQNEESENWIEHKEEVNVIYLDPSRRDTHQKRVFLLSDCTPNLIELSPKLWQKTSVILVKTAPFLDISSGLKEMPQTAEIHVVSAKNEVKEVLWLLKKNHQGNPRLFAVDIQTQTRSVSMEWEAAKNAQATLGPMGKYLYEPMASLMKLGVFSWISSNYNLTKISLNTHWYTLDQLIDFPGNTYIIKEIHPYKKSLFPWLKGQKANVKCKNFSWDPPQIKKKHQISDGGPRYLFFTTDWIGTQVVIEAEKAT
jgi:16S rRNA G966 N2-methylase RsmD